MFYRKALMALTTASLIGWSCAASAAEQVTVFAAASTTDAINEIGALFEQQGKGKLVASYASSSTLAKQIEQGAPAQIFISADQKWADYLEERKLFADGARVDLLGNRLALIAPKESDVTVKIEQGFPLASLLGDGRLAVGDPDHVPVGAYTKTALENLGVWDTVKDKLARGESVRVALAYVERGECPLGIVYSTDAAVAPNVKIAGVFPEGSHPPVVYPMAMIKGQESETAKAFYAFLKGPEAAAVFKKYGFEVK